MDRTRRSPGGTGSAFTGGQRTVQVPTDQNSRAEAPALTVGVTSGTCAVAVTAPLNPDSDPVTYAAEVAGAS
ncbi:hypothetical protein QWJ26_23175 [Streptomyces sp. CSDS2]|uniref:hypothetical protein n=1 Tax=Streptomyces sp. CSDS2 TaxID=3055051 RepID=UPI0025B12F3E|nr:hypothetical protein [Streptomyces sp. CSDS2]MDN3262651.1 hypothetical protein [Streptomyces sp. CSDS2]